MKSQHTYLYTEFPSGYSHLSLNENGVFNEDGGQQWPLDSASPPPPHFASNTFPLSLLC